MTSVAFGHVMLTMLVGTALVACWTDYRHHRVPNWLTASVLAAGLVGQSLVGGWRGFEQGLLGILAGGGPLLVLWMMRGMGAGDVKLMAAVGAWLGPELALQALVVGILAGGAMAVGVIALRGAWRQSSANLGLIMAKFSNSRTAFSDFASVDSLSGGRGALPYAIPLSVGSLWVSVSSLYGWWGAI